MSNKHGDLRRAYILLPAVIMAVYATFLMVEGRIAWGAVNIVLTVVLLAGGLPGAVALWRRHSKPSDQTGE